MTRAAPAVGALVALGLLLGGCGQRSADLFVVERSGTIPGARLTLLVGDGGTVRCNGGAAREITSADLIDARAIARELNGTEQEPGFAREGLSLPPGPGSILRYQVRSEGGTVRFADISRGQPQAFFDLAKLTRDLAKQVCGLAR
jgi:hypothetical protein